MLNLLTPSIQRTWSIVSGEFSPMWSSIYQGLIKRTVKLPQANELLDRQILAYSIQSLQQWSIDLITWPLSTSNNIRYDITLQPYTSRDSSKALMRQIRPPTERATSHWNNDPFKLNDGTGMQEYEPAVWRLPYYIMLYYKLI